MYALKVLTRCSLVCADVDDFLIKALIETDTLPRLGVQHEFGEQRAIGFASLVVRLTAVVFLFPVGWFGSQPDRRPRRYVSVSLLDRLTAARLRLRLGGGGRRVGSWYCCYCILRYVVLRGFLQLLTFGLFAFKLISFPLVHG